MKEISLGSKTCRSKSWQKLHMNHLDLPTPMKQTAEARDRVSPEFACGGGSPLRSLLGKSTLRRNLGEVEIRHRNTYCTVVGSRNTFRSNSQRLFFFGSSGRNIFCQMLHLFQWVENLLGEANGRKERFLWAFQAISATKNSTCLCLLYQKRSNAYYNSILASCYIYIFKYIIYIYMVITPITSHFQGLSVACLLRWLSWTQKTFGLKVDFLLWKPIPTNGRSWDPKHALSRLELRSVLRPAVVRPVCDPLLPSQSLDLKWVKTVKVEKTHGLGTLGILNHALKWPCHQRVFEALSLNRLYALFKNAVGNTRRQKATNSDPTHPFGKQQKHDWRWTSCDSTGSDSPMIHHSKYLKNSFQ